MAKIYKIIKNIQIPFWSFPVLLLGLAILSFGVLIPHLGFYWDDWAQILVGRLFSPGGYWEYFASDRPLSGWTHSILYSMLGARPSNWQITTLLFRYLTAILIFLTLNKIWPSSKRQSAWITILFLVYPVFTQQAISVAYHQHWLQFALFIASLYFMVLSITVERKRVIFTVISILLQILQLTILEYFVALELLRPILIGIVLVNTRQTPALSSRRNTLFRIIKTWLPYLFVLLAFTIWRLFIVQFPNGEDFNQPGVLLQLFSQPLTTLEYLFSFSSLDTIFILISTWTNLLDIHNFQDPQRFTQISWIIGFLVFLALSFYMTHLSSIENNSSEISTHQRKKWINQAFLLGVFGLILGPLPAWLIDKQVILDMHANRFAIPAMFGASVLWVVIIEWLSPFIKQKAIFLSFFVGLAVILHLNTANNYRWQWTDQTRFYWQLYWRAPNLEPGTAILSEDELFPDQGLFSTSSAINLLYPQSDTQDGLSYWVYSLRPKFTYLTSKPDEVPFSTRFRTLSFSGAAPDSIMVYKNFEKGNCLWVISQDDINDPELSDFTIDWLYLSNLENIHDITDTTYTPPSEIFGSEPEHTWCYFYQKADLARQSKNWDKVVEIGKEAQEKGYTPQKSSSNTPHEWLPFIQGYLMVGDYQQAADITLSVFEKAPSYTSRLCILWDNLKDQDSLDSHFIEIKNDTIDRLSCPGID